MYLYMQARTRTYTHTHNYRSNRIPPQALEDFVTYWSDCILPLERDVTTLVRYDCKPPLEGGVIYGSEYRTPLADAAITIILNFRTVVTVDRRKRIVLLTIVR